MTGTMFTERVDDDDIGLLARVSDPVRSSTPATCAPLMVAISSIWRAVSIVSGTPCRLPAERVERGPLGAEGRAHLGEDVARGRRHHVDRQARPQAELIGLVHRRPACPICSSIWGAIEIVPPVSCTRSHSWSLK